MDSDAPETPEESEAVAVAPLVEDDGPVDESVEAPTGRFAVITAKVKPMLKADHSKFVAGLLIGGLATFSVTATLGNDKVPAPVAAQLAEVRAEVAALKAGGHTTGEPVVGVQEHGGAEPGHEPTAKTEKPAKSGEAPHWTYAEAKDWGELSDQYIECKEGQEQSPIALDSEAAKRFAGEQEFEYEPHEVTVVDNGHTIQVNAAGAGMMKDGEHEYKLVQFHVHLPSEHTIDDTRYPLEIHLVHKDAEDKLAVVGVMVEEGRALNDFDGILAAIGEPGVETDMKEPFDPASLLPERHDVLRYDGSLTTPPCTEGVSWNVMAEPITMSKAQIEALKSHIHEANSRPLQPANGREPKMDIDLTR